MSVDFIVDSTKAQTVANKAVNLESTHKPSSILGVGFKADL